MTSERQSRSASFNAAELNNHRLDYHQQLAGWISQLTCMPLERDHSGMPALIDSMIGEYYHELNLTARALGCMVLASPSAKSGQRQILRCAGIFASGNIWVKTREQRGKSTAWNSVEPIEGVIIVPSDA